MLDGERPLRFFLEPVIGTDLADPLVREVVVNRPGEVGIERATGWVWRQVPELTLERLDQIGILAAYQTSKDFDGQHPICMTTLPDGERCTLVRPPATSKGTIVMCLRNPMTDEDVGTVHDASFKELMQAAEEAPLPAIDYELVDLLRAKDYGPFFSKAVKRKRTTVATGVVKSGKTSFIRKLAREVDIDERLVTSEDSDEFGKLPQRNRVSLFYGSAGVTALDCAELTLRLGPDRVFMQELRGEETFGFMRLLGAGNAGMLTTYHAEEGDPWTPLVLMAKQHPSMHTAPEDKLIEFFKKFIDIVVYCKRGPGGFSVSSVYFRDLVAADALAAKEAAGA